jgi:hypothetical protein
MIDRDSRAPSASASCETLTVCKHDISLGGSCKVHHIVKWWIWQLCVRSDTSYAGNEWCVTDGSNGPEHGIARTSLLLITTHSIYWVIVNEKAASKEGPSGRSLYTLKQYWDYGMLHYFTTNIVKINRLITERQKILPAPSDQHAAKHRVGRKGKSYYNLRP